jgi:hypothetical protein
MPSWTIFINKEKSSVAIKLNEFPAGHERLLLSFATAIGTLSSLCAAFRPTVHIRDQSGGATNLGVPKFGSQRLLARIEQDLLKDVQVVNFDADCADEFAKANAYLLSIGQPTSTADLLIAAVALANDFTIVTHNVADFQAIPGLRIQDWQS